ncbi:hypothetical protein [Bacillus pseudomycoides]|uniref:hypothetical protein n=1 Tax=Bacillus pseudomycoides TaxID=64104 RepID=UPI000BEC5DE8|nr:hypothetical protein [Bacillus pseudomycoides]PEA83126.1 hypothetical protein CON99_13600 [Bacillus pseudomycoides]PED08257.1 hypothetical protein COO19_11690 [Bacillus pseudomycoides]PEI87750.1 hypothetical protein CN686_26960 [Bacillus pseudomycoides]PEK23140.1 hypothetical protein CN693_13565 [Bacillus pseudomycoides]PEM76109.1 hypothetical protein CN619_08025 [Bacillus pseudomycoides]
MDILAVVPRVYVSTLQPHLDVYKVLLKQEAPHKFQINQTHVARFSNLLLIADENNVITNQVAVTIVTDSIQDIKQFILQKDGDILVDPSFVPTGLKMIARHPDGNVFEYIEPRQ